MPNGKLLESDLPTVWPRDLSAFSRNCFEFMLLSKLCAIVLLSPPDSSRFRVTTTPEIGVVNEVHDGGPHSDEEEHEHSDETRPAAWESWLYAMLSVALCAVVSLAGGLMMICGRAGIRHLMNLLGLAVGTLLGSALLSIFPETNATIGFGLGPCTVVLAGIMFGLLSEVGQAAMLSVLID